MKKNNTPYTALQKHLDTLPVGFPATSSGAEIRILKHIFSPLEAEVATHLRFRHETIDIVYERTGHLVDSVKALECLLDGILKKGGIEVAIVDNKMHYRNAPLVVGMYELQMGRLTPEFIRNFKKYTGSIKFGIEFLSTERPQMRTIPIAKSIKPRHEVATFDQVMTLVDRAEAPIAVVECICRKKAAMEGTACKLTDRKETCFAFGSIAQTVLLSGNGRSVSRDEAVSIIEKNQKQGMVLQPSNTEKASFLCSCCGCCCGMLSIHQKLPRPLEFWTSNFHAVVDSIACDGCGVCEMRCQVGAVKIAGEKTPAVVDLTRCLGCGVCVPTCHKKSISLEKNSTEIEPPQTREALYDIYMANKKGPLEKLKLTGKLLLDVVRTGHTQLLR